MRRVLLVMLLLLSTSAVGVADDVVGTRFKAFCAEWMQKLATRERDNRAAIRWQTGPDGVHGDYVGYSQDHECELKNGKDSKAVPIGKITYRELVYRQKGASVAEAKENTPRAIEATEVTEIFRYSKGKWVY